MKGLDHIYGGQAGSRKSSGGLALPKEERGGKNRRGFRKGYGGPKGPIETLTHGQPKGGGSPLPSPAMRGKAGPFPRGYGGPVGPIETLEHGSMTPRTKKKRYPHNCRKAAMALGKRGR